MAKSLMKGETSPVSVRFPSGFTVSGSPTWSLKDADGSEILDGTATLDADGLWRATITVPKNIPLDGGEQDFSVEFNAVSSTGRTLILTKTVSVIDVLDQWQSYGLIYTLGSPTVDTVAFFDRQPSKIIAIIREGYDTSAVIPTVPNYVGIGAEQQVAALNNVPMVRGMLAVLGGSLTYDSITSDGFAYNVSVPIDAANPIVDQSAGMFPFQLVVRGVFSDDGKDFDEFIKPVYVQTPVVVTRMNSVKRLLDKARLNEIDPTLQWFDEELIHALMEGLHYVNAFGEPTYWRLSQMPMQMYGPLTTAACWQALRARFLAEGLNAFDMQGATVQLTYNRREVIQTLADEMKAELDATLQMAKPASVRVNGKGTPPPGSMPEQGMSGIGALGIEYGVNTNPSRVFQVASRNNTIWRR